MNNFLIIAVDKLLTYKTPDSIVKYINLQLIIQNPPYNVKK
jgi:hypothetical protein